RELDRVGRSDRADLFAHPILEFAAHVLARLLTDFQRHEGVDALALNVVREADDGGFRYARVPHKRALHFRRAEAVAGDVDHVIDAAGDPVIAVLVTPAAIAGEIHAGVSR